MGHLKRESLDVKHQQRRNDVNFEPQMSSFALISILATIILPALYYLGYLDFIFPANKKKKVREFNEWVSISLKSADILIRSRFTEIEIKPEFPSPSNSQMLDSLVSRHSEQLKNFTYISVLIFQGDFRGKVIKLHSPPIYAEEEFIRSILDSQKEIIVLLNPKNLHEYHFQLNHLFGFAMQTP